MTDAWDNSVVAVIGWTLVHSIWQGLTIYLLLKAVLFTISRHFARLRYAVACSALIAVAAAMVTTATIVAMNHPQLLKRPPLAAETNSGTASSESALKNGLVVDSLGRVRVPRLPAATWEDYFIEWIGPHIPRVVSFWIAGTAAVLVWHLIGVSRVTYISNAGRRIHDHQAIRFDAIKARLGIRQAVRYILTTAVSTPATVGWIKPVVLLPMSLVTNFTPEEIDGFVAHELAHVRRLDYAVNVLQALLETLLFYHLCVWWISSIVRDEREACCDQIATAVIKDASGYGKALLRFTDVQPNIGRLSLGIASGSLLDRVARLVDRQQRRGMNVPAAVVVAIVCLACGSSLAYGVAERFTTLERQEAMMNTHESDFVFDLLGAKSNNPSLESALADGLNAIATNAPPADARYDALADSLDRGDPYLVWNAYRSNLDLIKYPITTPDFPKSWRFATSEKQGRLAKLFWRKAVSSGAVLERSRYARIAVLLAAMKREQSSVLILSSIVMDKRFERTAALPHSQYLSLVQFVSVANDTLGFEMNVYRSWQQRVVKGVDEDSTDSLPTIRWGRFPEIDRQVMLIIARLEERSRLRISLTAAIGTTASKLQLDCGLYKLCELSPKAAAALRDSAAVPEIIHPAQQ